jgi:hypothetical protein
VYASRHADGTLKEKIPWSGLLLMGGFLVTIVGFLVAANCIGLYRRRVSLDFGDLFCLNFTLYIILFLYDTLFIDGFVLGYWRPKFLKLPAELGRESMRGHMLRSIPVGLGVGILLAFASTMISYFAFWQ